MSLQVKYVCRLWKLDEIIGVNNFVLKWLNNQYYGYLNLRLLCGRGRY